jgi:hypothetical protein
MYSRGEGVLEDDAEAVRWYRLAADQGDALAQTNLGFMYAHGDGVPPDLVFAYMWFSLSADQGNETAQSNEQIIGQYLTREQFAEAQRRFREWIAEHPQDGGN